MTLSQPAGVEPEALVSALDESLAGYPDVPAHSVESKLGAIVVNVELDTPANQFSADEMIRQRIRDLISDRGWGDAEILN